MLISHIFKPKTSIYSKKTAVDFAFISFLYRERVSVNYKVFYIAVTERGQKAL